jgi:hypothetical protein
MVRCTTATLLFVVHAAPGSWREIKSAGNCEKVCHWSWVQHNKYDGVILELIFTYLVALKIEIKLVCAVCGHLDVGKFVLVSSLASSDTMKSEGRQMK